jgi:hypothetical protein
VIQPASIRKYDSTGMLTRSRSRSVSATPERDQSAEGGSAQRDQPRLATVSIATTGASWELGQLAIVQRMNAWRILRPG